MKRRVEDQIRQNDVSDFPSIVESGCYGHQMKILFVEPCPDNANNNLAKPEKRLRRTLLVNPQVTPAKKRVRISNDQQTQPVESTVGGTYFRMVGSTAKKSGAIVQNVSQSETSSRGSHRAHSDIMEVNTSSPKQSKLLWRAGEFARPIEKLDSPKSYDSIQKDLCSNFVTRQSRLTRSTSTDGVKHNYNEVDSCLDKLDNSAVDSTASISVIQQKSAKLCRVRKAKARNCRMGAYSSEKRTKKLGLFPVGSIREGFAAGGFAKQSQLMKINSSNDGIQHNIHEGKPDLHLQDLTTWDGTKRSEMTRNIASIVGMKWEVNPVESTIDALMHSAVSIVLGETMKELDYEGLGCVWEASNCHMEELSPNDELLITAEENLPLPNRSQKDTESDLLQLKSVSLFGSGHHLSNGGVDCCVWEAVEDYREECSFDAMENEVGVQNDDNHSSSIINHLQAACDEDEVILHNHNEEYCRTSQLEKNILSGQEGCECLASSEETQNKRILQFSSLHKNACGENMRLPMVSAVGVTEETVDKTSGLRSQIPYQSFVEEFETGDLDSGELLIGECNLFVSKCHISSRALINDLQTPDSLEKTIERHQVASTVKKKASLNHGSSPLYCPKVVMSNEDPCTSVVSPTLLNCPEPVICSFDKHNASVPISSKAVQYVNTSLLSRPTDCCCHELEAGSITPNQHYIELPPINLSKTVHVLTELLNSFENDLCSVPYQNNDEEQSDSAALCLPSLKTKPIPIPPLVGHGPASELTVLVAKPGDSLSLHTHLKVSKPTSVSEETCGSENASAEEASQAREQRTSKNRLSHNSSCASNLSAKTSLIAVKTSSENNEGDAFTELQKFNCHKTALGLRSNPPKFCPFQSLHTPNGKIQSSKVTVISKETHSKAVVTPIRLTRPCVASSDSCHSRRRKSVSSLSGAIVNGTKDSESIPKVFPIGDLVWARLGSQNWWPAMIVSAVDCGRRATKPDCCWVFWFGDHKISEVSCLKIVPFVVEYTSKYSSRYSSKHFKLAVWEIIKEHARRVRRKLPGTLEEALNWAESGFVIRKRVNTSDKSELVSDVPEWVMKELAMIRQQMLHSDSDSHHTDSEYGKSTGDCINMNLVLSKVRRGELSIDEICISCGDQERSTMEQHPFIRGGLCHKCMMNLSSAIFMFENDGASAFCIICSNGGQICVCGNTGCNKVYCSSCIRMFGSKDELQLVRNTNPWLCYICTSEVCSTSSLLEGRKDWRENLVKLLAPPDAVAPISSCISDRQPIRVLSLFDGLGTGKIVLNQLGIEVGEYFSSEIDESAILVTRVRHGDTVTQLGCVTAINKKTLQSILPIDLLIGGSPCNNLSIANPQRKGLDSETGSLFFEFCRVLSTLRAMNPPNRHLYWLFENVASMQRETKDTISRHLNCQPALWDAKHFSAMRRARYFWGNIPDMYCPLQYRNVNAASSSCTLSESLFPSRSALVPKMRTITTKANSLMQAGKADDAFPVMTADGVVDTLWIPEIERVFGFPEHYTDVANLSHSRRQKLLGQAWSVLVVRHLLSPLQNCFRSSQNDAK